MESVHLFSPKIRHLVSNVLSDVTSASYFDNLEADNDGNSTAAVVTVRQQQRPTAPKMPTTMKATRRRGKIPLQDRWSGGWGSWRMVPPSAGTGQGWGLVPGWPCRAGRDGGRGQIQGVPRRLGSALMRCPPVHRCSRYSPLPSCVEAKTILPWSNSQNHIGFQDNI